MKFTQHSHLPIYFARHGKNIQFSGKHQPPGLAEKDGSRVGGIFHLWGRVRSCYFILRPKGLLDNFFVRQVGMLKQEAGPKAT
jgi:hypothetical protein